MREHNLAVLCQGQGVQSPGMFKELLESKDPHVKRSAQETLGLLEKIKREVFETYINPETRAERVNNTVNVQPALAATSIIWHKSLESLLGEKITPQVAGGFSLGDFTATYPLGILTEEHLLNLACLRGEVFAPIKPGQFHVGTVVAKNDVNLRRTNWTLRGTGYRVTIRHSDKMVTFAGPAENKREFEVWVAEQLENQSMERYIPADAEKFYIPFHHYRAISDIAKFFQSQLEKYCKRNESVCARPKGTFVTNDGKLLRSAADIKSYLGRPHITNRCDFASTMLAADRNAQTIIGLGNMLIQQKTAMRQGLTSNFIFVNSPEELYKAAAAVEQVLNARQKQKSPAYALA